MARTVLAAQAISDAGLEPAYTAANADGHAIDAAAILHVKNGGGAAIDVTIVTGGTFAGKAIADTVVNVPAGEERFIGGLRADLYAQPAGAADSPGKVLVDFSDVTTVTVAALEG